VRTESGGSPQPYAWLSGDELLRGSPLLFPDEIADPPRLARALRDGSNAVMRDVAARLPANIRAGLPRHTRPGADALAFRCALTESLNRILITAHLHHPVDAAQVEPQADAGQPWRNRRVVEEAAGEALRPYANRLKKGVPGEPGVGQVLKLDARLDVVARYDAGASLLSCRVLDLDGNGVGELVAADSWGYLHLLDADLNLVRKVSVTTNLYTRVDLALVGFTNLVADGPPRLVLSSSQLELVHAGPIGNDREDATTHTWHHNEIVVLDAALNPILRQEVVPELSGGLGENWVRVADTEGDGVAEVLVLTDALTVYRFR
jgi:hypothetical protein